MSFILNQSHAIGYLADWYKEHPDYNGFSYGALEAIAGYLSETETDREVDPVQLACEWREETLEEAVNTYCGTIPTEVSELIESDRGEVLYWFNQQTNFLSIENSNKYVYVQF